MRIVASLLLMAVSWSLWACSSDTSLFSGTGGAAGAGGSAMSTSGSGAGSSVTSGGGAGTCVPGATESCYSGPAGTLGVGSCVAGERTCLPDGSGFGACDGEVVPAFEDCSTNADEDCNGQTPACTGTHLWSRKLDGGVPSSVALDAAGDALVTGMINSGSVDLGGGPIAGPGLFLGKYDPQGNYLSGTAFPSQGVNAAPVPGPVSVAADASGNALLAGFFSLTVDFGGGALASAAAYSHDVFVAKLSPGGMHLWSKRFGDVDEQEAYEVAADANGNVIVVGSTKGTVDFGGGPLAPSGGWDIFVLELDPNGNHSWSKRFGDASDQWASDVAIDPAGNVVVSGYFHGTVNFGGQPLVEVGGSDTFVVKLDPAGNHLWSKRFGGTAQELIWSVATDPAGNVAVAGMFDGTFDLGGAPLVSAGSYDVFAGKLDQAGNHLWSKRFGDSGGQQIAMGVGCDASGAVVPAGYFQSSVDFGGGLLVTAGSFDIFSAKLSANGNYVWGQRFGDSVEQDLFDVAVAPSGESVLVGMFWGQLGFGGPPLTATDGVDGYVARFSP